MAKSMVEKYEQILSADPGSMVFVELAKALLDRGESQRAIDICSAGLQHHPESVVGRVLWGKALINSGKPVEAMAQFDEAIAIDRDNPYAYNLIGEVLLHKGLHRSALPILKKAVALQPTDGRVRQWLEQTTRALNGDKTPIKRDFTQIDPPPDSQATIPGRPSLPSLEEAAAVAAAPSSTASPAAAVAAASPAPQPVAPSSPALPSSRPPVASPGPADHHADSPELVRGMTDVFQSLSSRPPEVSDPGVPPPKPEPIPAASTPSTPAAEASWGAEVAAPAPTQAPSAATALFPEITGPQPMAPQAGAVPDPSSPEEAPAPTPNVDRPHAVPESRAAEPTLPGPPPVHEAAADAKGEPAPPKPVAALPRAVEVAAESVGEPPPGFTVPGPPPPTPTSTPAEPAEPAAQPVKPPQDAVPLPPDPIAAMSVGTVAPSLPAPGAAPPPRPPPLANKLKPTPAPISGGPPPLSAKGKSSRAVLPELISNPGATKSMELPKVELSSQAAEDIAKQYEQELRAKLAAVENKPPSFLAKHGLKLGIVALLAVVSISGVAVFRYQKRVHTNVPESLARARTGIDKDTQASYQAALVEAADVEAARPDEPQAYALAAYAHAVLYREHGQAPADREEALKALGQADAASKYPDLAAAARYFLADSESDRQAADKEVLATTGGAEVKELAGRLRLLTDSNRGLALLRESLKDDANHVRSYVLLGNYDLEKADPTSAYAMFSQAKTLSEHHPEVLLGLDQARLALSKELDEARADVAALDKETSLSPEVHSLLDLVAGRLLAEAGKADEAQKRLEQGLAQDPGRSMEFHRSLAEVYSLRGERDRAFGELSSALREHPHDPVLLESTARTAIALGRPQDALKLTEGSDDRKLRLVRGLADFDLGEFEAAKKELLATKHDGGNMPSEAAVALARVDLALGHKEDARAPLSAIAKAGKVNPFAHLAQGELALADGDREAAKKELAAAAEDPHQAVASFELAQELFAEGKLTEAQKALIQAVDRNHFLSGAQLLLARVMVDLGAPIPAQPHLQSYLKEHRDDPVALSLLARLDLARGDLVEARRASEQAVAHPGKDAAEAAWTHSQVALAAGDGSAALRDIEKRAKASRSAEVWCELGEALVDLDDPRDALASFAKALKLDRQSARARVDQAIAEAAKGGKGTRSLEMLADPSNHLPPILQARVVAGLARAKTGDSARALAQKAVDISEASSEAQLALGETLTGDEAVAALAKAAALEPANAEAHAALAEALVQKGDAAAALAEAEVARRISPHGPSAERAKRVVASDGKRRGK